MKASLIDKLIDRLDSLPKEAVQTLIVRLMRQKGALNQVIDAIREAIFILDAQGRISFANRSAIKLAGSASQPSGRLLTEVLPGFDWSEWLTPGSSHSRDLQVFYPERKWLNVYMSPLDIQEQDAASGFLLLLRDITSEREKTEQDLANEAIGAIQHLAAGVAHEIGNPLNSLSIHLQLLRRKLDKLQIPQIESLSRHLRVAEAETQRLDLILKQFLSALRPGQLQREPVSLNTLLAETLTLVTPELEQRNVMVNLDLDPNLPLLKLDPTRIKQVFFNLLKNAWQAMPESASSPSLITIQSGFSNYEVWLRISDTGCGIPPEVMGTMFEPFTTTKASGNGLGMFIVQQILREHGGIIEVDSKQDQGTSILLQFNRQDQQVRLLDS